MTTDGVETRGVVPPWHAMVERAYDPIIVCDGSSAVIYVNAAATETLGWTVEELLGRPGLDLVHPDDRELALVDLLRLPEAYSKREPTPLRVQRSDQSYLEVEVAGRAITAGTLDDGAVLIMRDVTGHRQLQRALVAGQLLNKAILEHVTEGVLACDTEGHVIAANRVLREMFRWPESGLHFTDDEYTAHREHDGRRITATDGPIQWLLAGREVDNLEVLLRHADGTTRHLRESGAVMRSSSGEVAGVVLTIRDITSEREVAEQLTRKALYDPLTGLANRVLLTERLEFALQRSSRLEGDVLVMFIDLDRFKIINDSLGHSAGDLMLKEVAARLATVTRPGDTVARLGGDEFVILCESMDLTAAGELANRVQDRLRLPMTIAGNNVRCSASIGLALARPGLHEPGELLQDADAAMYHAKETGRGHHEMFDDHLRERALQRLEAEQTLVRVIENNQLIALYLLAVDLRTGRIHTVEALMRYRDRRGKTISPNDFIEVAEDTGLITRIDTWMLNEAAQQLSQWMTVVPDLQLRVSCNVSAAQIGRPDLVDIVMHAAMANGLEPTQLCFEVAETSIISATSTTLSNLNQLRDLGCALGIDDFGTGYSSLSQLRDFPLRFVKIDRTFTAKLMKDHSSTAIVDAMVDLAHALNMLVVAEGVETAEQASYLRSIGCDYGQGFYFCPPITADDILDILKSGGMLADPAEQHLPTLRPSAGSAVRQ